MWYDLIIHRNPCNQRTTFHCSVHWLRKTLFLQILCGIIPHNVFDFIDAIAQQHAVVLFVTRERYDKLSLDVRLNNIVPHIINVVPGHRRPSFPDISPLAAPNTRDEKSNALNIEQYMGIFGRIGSPFCCEDLELLNLAEAHQVVVFGNPDLDRYGMEPISAGMFLSVRSSVLLVFLFRRFF
jgi:hypothetical protein